MHLLINYLDKVWEIVLFYSLNYLGPKIQQTNRLKLNPDSVNSLPRLTRSFSKKGWFHTTLLITGKTKSAGQTGANQN